MRRLRTLLYLVVGVLLGANLSLAYAETVPATVKPGSTAPQLMYETGNPARTFSTGAAVCSWMNTQNSSYYTYVWATSGSYPNGYCKATTNKPFDGWGTAPGQVNRCWTPDGATTVWPVGGVCNPQYECPASGGWTISGTGAASVCTRADCVAPNVRNATTGVCESACLSKAAQPATYAWHTSFKGVDNSGPRCDNGCAVSVALDTSTSEYYYTATTITLRMSTSYTGAACTVGTGTPAPAPANTVAPPTPPKKPVCAANEGVLTTSKGTVACVPPGVDSAEVPSVSVKKTTETFDDGSQKITTDTSTKVPSTGVEDINHAVTITPNSAGTAGAAGTPGTSGSSTATATDATGDGQADGGDGDCDPSVAACGGPGVFGENNGLYTKKYENGLTGVLEEKYAAMKATPLFGLVGSLAPSGLSNAGTCPSWTLSTAIGPGMNFGSGSIAPPCWIWSVLRVIFLVTTLLLARRLIFGG